MIVSLWDAAESVLESQRREEYGNYQNRRK